MLQQLTLRADGHARSLMWRDGDMVNAADTAALALPEDGVVTLWHPMQDVDDQEAAD